MSTMSWQTWYVNSEIALDTLQFEMTLVLLAALTAKGGTYDENVEEVEVLTSLLDGLELDTSGEEG